MNLQRKSDTVTIALKKSYLRAAAIAAARQESLSILYDCMGFPPGTTAFLTIRGSGRETRHAASHKLFSAITLTPQNHRKAAALGIRFISQYELKSMSHFSG